MGVDMGCSGRKKHYSCAERALLRRKAEKACKARKRDREQRQQERRKREELHAVRWVAFNRNPEKLISECENNLSDAKRAQVRDLFASLVARRPGLLCNPFMNGFRAFAYVDWLRDPETWRPQGKSLDRAYRAIAAHLLGEYPINDHLWDIVMFPAGQRRLHRATVRFVSGLACGRSLRNMVGTKILPVPLTRRMQHILANPPRSLSYVHLVRRAQVLGFGGTEKLADDLMQTALRQFRCGEDYWATVIHWLCRNGPLDRLTTRQIVDYLDDRRAEDETLTMKRRGLERLARDAERYYRRYYESPQPVRRWADRSDPGYGQWAGRSKCGIQGMQGDNWEVRPITTARQMVLEGNIMHHCLASFRSFLKNGACSYWTLYRFGKRKLNIEVNNESREILTMAGKANRFPRDQELHLIRIWAAANNVKIPEFLR